MQLLWPGQQAAPEQQNYWEQQHTHQYAQGQQYVDQTNREIQYTEYEGVEGSRGMNPILRGVLVIVAVVAVGAGGFWAYNTVFKHTAGSTAAQSTGASQPAQNAGNTVQPSSPAQPAASPPQPASAPSQSPASPASPPAQSQQAPQTPPPASPPTYTPPDNGFNGGQTTPPDNAFSSGGNRTPPDNTY